MCHHRRLLSLSLSILVLIKLFFYMAGTIQLLNQNTMRKSKNITKKGMKSQGGMNIYSARVWRRNYCKLDWVKTTISRKRKIICSKNPRNLQHQANNQFTHIITQNQQERNNSSNSRSADQKEGSNTIYTSHLIFELT